MLSCTGPTGLCWKNRCTRPFHWTSPFGSFIHPRAGAKCKTGRGRLILSRCPRYPAHEVELLVRHGLGQVRQPVRHGEEGADRADVPDVLVGQAVRAQRAQDLVVDGPRLDREPDRDVEDGPLAVVEFGAAPVGGDLVRDPGVARPDPGDRAVGHHDQFPVALAERRRLLVHERVVVGEERAPLGRTPGQGEEDVGDEPGFLRDLLDPGPQVLGYVLDRWHVEHAPHPNPRPSGRPGRQGRPGRTGPGPSRRCWREGPGTFTAGVSGTWWRVPPPGPRRRPRPRRSRRG